MVHGVGVTKKRSGKEEDSVKAGISVSQLGEKWEKYLEGKVGVVLESTDNKDWRREKRKSGPAPAVWAWLGTADCTVSAGLWLGTVECAVSAGCLWYSATALVGSLLSCFVYFMLFS